MQRDLKRVLAYSTISQIGYMFLALGVSGWEAAVFHFMTHAFFKALLFLCAGVIIEALADEHDIFKMGGLRKKLPGVFWTFVIGAAALAALPFVTDGFYSKDLIIAASLGSVDGSLWFYTGAIVGAFVTALYSFRLVWIVFFGAQHTEVTRRPRWRQMVPLYVLATLAVVGGLVWMPEWLLGFHPLEDFLDTVLPHMPWAEGAWAESAAAALVTIGVVSLGIYASYLLWLRWRARTDAFAARPFVRGVAAWWRADWGFDVAYEYVFVIPVRWFAHWARHDLVEPAIEGIAWLNVAAWRALSATQTGLLRLYIGVAGVGLVVLLAFVVLR